MRKLLLILMVVLLAACGHNNKNNMIDFTYAGNIPIIGDTINNEAVHFIIDTGAGMSIINSEYYQEHKRDLIRLSDIEMQLVGINGATPLQTAASVGINTSIGYCRFYESDLSAVVSKMNDRGYNVIGVIGSDFWKQGYVINYKTRQVTKCN